MSRSFVSTPSLCRCMAMRLVLGLISSLLTSTSWATEPLVDLMSATCRIDGNTSATGFFVERGDSPRSAWLVTVAHAFDKIDGPECRLILRRNEGESTTRRVWPVAIRAEGKPLWKAHAQEDVAILAVELPEDTTMQRLPLAQLADEPTIRRVELSPGDDLWVAGFPSAMEANAAGWPVLRKGHVASYPIVPVAQFRTMMVQINSFGGDSGAPVAIVDDGRPMIVAAVVGLHRVTTRQSSEFEERTSHLPMQIAYVAHAAWIRELIAAQK